MGILSSVSLSDAGADFECLQIITVNLRHPKLAFFSQTLPFLGEVKGRTVP